MGKKIWLARDLDGNTISEYVASKAHLSDIMERGYSHWMEPIPLPVEDGFEEWWDDCLPGCVDYRIDMTRSAWQAALAWKEKQK